MPQAMGFKLSKDPLFIEKVRDIVGPHLNPPDKRLRCASMRRRRFRRSIAVGRCCPVRPGQAERRIPDYVRHGTINLFAALDAKAGTVIGEFHRRPRAREFAAFWKPSTLPCRVCWSCI